MHWQTSHQVFLQLQASHLIFPNLTMLMTMATGYLGTLTSASGPQKMMSPAPSLSMMFAPNYSCPESSPRPSTSRPSAPGTVP